MAVDDYLKTIGQKKSCLVISPVWSDIHRFTSQVRPRLKAASVLAEADKAILTYHSYQWTDAARQDARKYKVETFWLSITTAPGSPRGNMSPLRNSRGKDRGAG